MVAVVSIAETQQHLDALRAQTRKRSYISAGWLADWRARAHELLLGLVGRELPEDAAKLRSRLAVALDRDAVKRVERHNQRFLERCLEKDADFFETVEAHPLTRRQREVIARPEPNLLVLAGAGAGKTSTVVGQVGYLLHDKKADPSEILLLAYNRKAARELEERIQQRLGARVAAWTFHRLGRQIISAVEGRAPTLDDSATNQRALSDLLGDIVRELFTSSYRDIARYFLFFHRPFRPPHRFTERADYQRYLRSYEVKTFQGEAVHSAEACIVANWLYCNGIDYVYRPRYPGGGSYRPDFLLSAAEVYVDIAVLDEAGEPPPFVDADRYRARLAQARALHAEKNTHRVEVTSADLIANQLARRLRKRLQPLGVVLSPLPADTLLDTLERRRDIDQLVTLLATFLHHAKSSGLDHAALRRAASRAVDVHRAAAFADLFSVVRRRYEATLKARGAIDFDDMIARATRYAESGRYRSAFRHIVVDEFQDISQGRIRLLRALLEQVEDRQLLCVGDDWQSIYRFAGSDIHLLRRLGELVGPVKVTALDQTFRFHDGLAGLSAYFVTRNPAQLSKEVVSRRKASGASAIILAEQDCPGGALPAALAEISAEVGDEGASVLLLGRYRFLEPDLAALSAEHPSLTLSFMTVHAAKGLEADYAIVMGLVSGRLGFPTEISDDPLLELVLSAPEGCDNAEERRLFYVALTRARRRVFLLTDQRRPSVFVEELQSSDYTDWVRVGSG